MTPMPCLPAGRQALSKAWVHWTLFNIDPTTVEIAENSVPQGAQEGLTDFGRPGYGGPCPPASQRGEPSGKHRYFFKLYALDVVLNLAGNPIKEAIEEAMRGHLVDSSEFIGLYQRGA